MPDVAVISVTLNAVTPMMAGFAADGGGWGVKNYLDEGLQADVAADGGVKDRSLSHMGALIGRAIAGGAEAVLLTCTVFSPYLPALRQIFSVPLIGADVAMLEAAAKLGKRTAILCTFPASLETSLAMFEGAAKAQGTGARGEVFLVEGALDAMRAGDRARHDALIVEAIARHATSHEVIVLAQMSMMAAAASIRDCPVPILTSPACALEAVKEALGDQLSR